MAPSSDDNSISSQRGYISHLQIRVTDVDRAAQFYGALFSWQFERTELPGFAEQRATLASRAGNSIRAVFRNDSSAPPLRVEFDVQDSERALARARALGGNGEVGAAFDDQGIALAFSARKQSAPSVEGVQPGDIAVVIFDVPDTEKARAFHSGLFGRTYHQIGSGDRWWIDGQAVGIFRAPASAVRFWCVVAALEPALAEVSRLGGCLVERGSMGPYQVCDCRDDQGTQFGLWYDENLRFARAGG